MVLDNFLPSTHLDGGILRRELLVPVDVHPTMGEVERLVVMLGLECLQSLECLQMNSMQAYGQMDMQAYWQMDMQAQRKQRWTHVYHIFDAESAHGTSLDALKGGTKLVALLLYHPPTLREGHLPLLALHLVWRELLVFT